MNIYKERSFSNWFITRNRPDIQRKLVDEYLVDAKNDFRKQQEILSMLSYEDRTSSQEQIKVLKEGFCDIKQGFQRLEKEVVTNTTETKNLKTAISTRINMKFEGEFKADGDDFRGSIDKATYKSLRNQ